MLAIGLLATICAGCGTTRWSDSARTATEQLLISDALDRAVSSFDFRALAGKKVFLDTTYIKGSSDEAYLTSSLRQHALASGCVLKANREEADYIAEVRAGTLGTDRHDVLFGIPATSIPTGTLGTNATIPEIPLIKKTDQRAVVKIAVFAYNRASGRPIWQSGFVPVESTAKDIWVFGAGPFKKGNIHKGTSYAGEKLPIPLIEPGDAHNASSLGSVSVATEAYFTEPNDPPEMPRFQQPARPELALPGNQPPMQGWPASYSAPGTGSPAPAAGLTPAPAGSGQLAPIQSQGGFFPSGPTTPGAMPAVPLQIPQFPAISSRLGK